MIVYLIGMPGVGKSTLGKRLARQVGYNFVDLDAWIEVRERQSVAELFARGEAYFRKCECAALHSTTRGDKLVVATGGGVVTQQINITRMRQHGLVIYLTRPLKSIMATLNPNRRPLLAKRPDVLYDLYAERGSRYREAAHHCIDCTVRREAIRKLSEVIHRENQNY